MFLGQTSVFRSIYFEFYFSVFLYLCISVASFRYVIGIYHYYVLFFLKCKQQICSCYHSIFRLTVFLEFLDRCDFDPSIVFVKVPQLYLLLHFSLLCFIVTPFLCLYSTSSEHSDPIIFSANMLRHLFRLWALLRSCLILTPSSLSNDLALFCFLLFTINVLSLKKEKIKKKKGYVFTFCLNILHLPYDSS